MGTKQPNTNRALQYAVFFGSKWALLPKGTKPIAVAKLHEQHPEYEIRSVQNDAGSSWDSPTFRTVSDIVYPATNTSAPAVLISKSTGTRISPKMPKIGR